MQTAVGRDYFREIWIAKAVRRLSHREIRRETESAALIYVASSDGCLQLTFPLRLSCPEFEREKRELSPFQPCGICGRKNLHAICTIYFVSSALNLLVTASPDSSFECQLFSFHSYFRNAHPCFLLICKCVASHYVFDMLSESERVLPTETDIAFFISYHMQDKQMDKSESPAGFSVPELSMMRSDFSFSLDNSTWLED